MFLPPESLVPFKARRLANAETVYLNPQYSNTDENWLDKYAYLIPGEKHCSDDFLPQEKDFLAERYGGGRIVTHGGGVRCGLDGDFSVKGIGCNLLMGRDARQMNADHSDGALPLAGAIQEAVWGNVLHCALPFGSVRVAALILIGTNSPQNTIGMTSGALVVRKAVLRPAHFERAVYFRPKAGVSLVHDTLRVKKAIELLPEVLPQSVGLSATELASFTIGERLNQGLIEFCKRLAAQSAVALSRRFVHGALTASNVGLDGCWLDFGTTMSFQTYANASIKEDIPPLWEEYLANIPIIKNLHFYIQKYFPKNKNQALVQEQQLIQVFIQNYQSVLAQAFLNLAGFPSILLKPYGQSEEGLRLAIMLIEISRLYASRPMYVATRKWEQFGPNRLGDLLPVLACWYDHPSCSQRIKHLVEDDIYREELISAYRNISEKLLAGSKKSGVSPQALRRLIYLNAIKVSKTVSEIDADEVCQRYLRGDGFTLEELQSYIDSATYKAQVVYQASSKFSSLLWKEDGESILYEADMDQWKKVSRAGTKTFSWDEILNSSELSQVREYWGDPIWIAISERENVLEPFDTKVVASA